MVLSLFFKHFFPEFVLGWCETEPHFFVKKKEVNLRKSLRVNVLFPHVWTLMYHFYASNTQHILQDHLKILALQWKEEKNIHSDMQLSNAESTLEWYATDGRSREDGLWIITSSPTDRHTFSKMWKCVLVGLALVLPGFLLSVEGKHAEKNQGEFVCDRC